MLFCKTRTETVISNQMNFKKPQTNNFLGQISYEADIQYFLV